jgi:predicted nucleic acid-binding protein
VIVVDTNVLAYFMLAGKASASISALYGCDPDWCAPLLWRSEMRNVLSLQVRHRELPIKEAQDMMRDAEDLMEGREHHVASVEVLILALQSGCTTYDCEYAALALALDLPLVTTDKKVQRAFRPFAFSPRSYLRRAG